LLLRELLIGYPHLKAAGCIDEIDDVMYNWLKDVISFTKMDSNMWLKLLRKLRCFFVEEVEYTDETMKILNSPNSKTVLEAVKKAIEEADEITEEYVKDLLKKLAKRNECKRERIFHANQSSSNRRRPWT
ncbi:glutamyl-tRNA synthetase, partial [Thermoanaerobacter ethanolicus JW 200]